jgi:hypothetical protein
LAEAFDVGSWVLFEVGTVDDVLVRFSFPLNPATVLSRVGWDKGTTEKPEESEWEEIDPDRGSGV